MRQFFKDISNFNNTWDYLPILAGVLTVETFVIYFAFLSNSSKVLQDWYRNYTLAAVMADVLVVVIVMIVARFLYPLLFSGFSILSFVGLVLGLQIIHDLLFYKGFSLVPKGYNRMLDTFKKYAKEVGGYAILGDSVIVILSSLFASHLATHGTNWNIIGIITSLYFIPYLLYHK
jgi:hypothetical protein